MIKIILSILLISHIFSITDLYVGYSEKENYFEKVQEAIDKAASINPKKEDERVIIHIAPGTYRQQIVINTPYITFINDEPSKGDVLLTFYYGVGYKYYSTNDKGFFDETLFEKKSEKKSGVYRWGASVHILKDASYFKAQNINFENSFNRYMTEEEIEDGVEVSGDTAINVNRTLSLDVRAKSSTERAAAISIEAPFVEFLNCRFYSSQDTLYTGGSPLYFKNCLIEGQTDYIFGGSNAIFDSCELRWKGFSKDPNGGHITASNTEDFGYLFVNCKVTKNKSLQVKAGDFGRPWSKTAQVFYINTVLEDSTTIVPAGWGSMGGTSPEDVEGFKESGTKYKDGSPVNTSQRKGHVLSMDDLGYIDINGYLKDWEPTFMQESNDD